MKLSIIAVSIDDTLTMVRRLFASLTKQTSGNFEVIFVYGASVQEDAVTKLAGDFPGLTLTCLRARDRCLSRSRNAGLAVAAGNAVAFADDDCAYEPDAVAGVCAAFAENTDAGLIMGRPIDFETDARRSGAKPTPLGRYGVFRECPSFVHFYRVEAVRAVGNFDESLGVGSGTPFLSGEETDYALRALDAGFTALRAPSVFVRHPAVNTRSPALAAKVAAYAAGRMRLLHKHAFPAWFLAANVLYPLLRLLPDCLKSCVPVALYRWRMFAARLKWLRDAQ